MAERVAVVGGFGRMGAQVLRVLGQRGVSAVPVSRRTGFDLRRSGPAALAGALDGADAVIDCSDSAGGRVATFAAPATALAEAAGRAGAGRLVVVSIVGIDRPGLARMSYYQGKLAQEAALAEGQVPVTVVRSTQWYGFADQVYASVPLGPAGRAGLAPRMRMQPVSGRAVARRLVRAALDDAVPGRVELAGPEPMTLVELVRRIWRARGVRAWTAEVPIPGLPGFTDGSLLPGPDAEIDPATVEHWVETERLSRPAG
jgi:uncharacterized protein YbjT (DUF2867 family)